MRLLSTLLVLAALAPAAAWGQGWVVDAAAGGADHQTVAADVGTRSAILGVRHEGPRWLYLSVAAPLDSVGFPWAAAGLGGRISTERGLLELGIDLAGHAHGYHDQVLNAGGGGGTAEALPFIAVMRRSARLELFSGIRAYASRLDSVSYSRRVLDNGARLSVAHGARLVFHGEGRVVRAEEGSFPYVGAGVDFSHPRGELWGYAGRWVSDALADPAWGAGGALAVGRRFRLELSVAQESYDPLYWNAPRRLWSVGLSRTFGPAPGRLLEVASPVVPKAPNGRITLRIPAAEADRTPVVAGDFTQWKPLAMTRVGAYWEAALILPPGVYRYAFRRADGSWFVPESIPDRVDDGFGGVSAVLIVP